jgi:hypothetical protein
MQAKYGKVENGKVTQLFTSKPLWFEENKQLVSDDKLKDLGVYPVNLRELDSFDSRKELMQYRGKDELIVDEENKIINNYVYKITKSSNSLFSEISKKIDKMRDGQIYSDVPYRFSDTSYDLNDEWDVDFIQLRNDIDLRNVQVNGIAAMKDIMEGNSGAQHVYKDRGNVIHTISAADMVAMASHVKNVGQSVYAASWVHKHNIKVIIDNPELTEEQKVDALVDYNILSNWPVLPEPREEAPVEEEPIE